MNNITLEEFQKVEIKIGTVLEAEKVPEGDRLLKLIVDFGLKELAVIASEAKQSGSEDEIAASSHQGGTPRNDE